MESLSFQVVAPRCLSEAISHGLTKLSEILDTEGDDNRITWKLPGGEQAFIPAYEAVEVLAVYCDGLLGDLRSQSAPFAEDFHVLEIAMPALLAAVEISLPRQMINDSPEDSVRPRARGLVVDLCISSLALLMESLDPSVPVENGLLVKMQLATRCSKTLGRVVSFCLQRYTNVVGPIETSSAAHAARVKAMQWATMVVTHKEVATIAKCLDMVLAALNCPASQDCYDLSKWQNLASVEFWDCARGLLQLMEYLCYSDAYVQHLVNNPCFPSILQHIYRLLWVPHTTVQMMKEAKLAALKMLIPLCENEKPYFLDFFSGTIQDQTHSNLSVLVAKRVITLSRSICELVPQAMKSNKKPDEFEQQVSREAFRVLELLSYDSGFISTVVGGATENLLRYLSMDQETFAELFTNHQSYEEDITVLIFRLIANLHCYNPSVSPVTHKDMFVNCIVEHCHSMYSTIESNARGSQLQLKKESNLSVLNVATNLFTLFIKVTSDYSYSAVELELWTDFLGKMRTHLHLDLPTIVATSTPAATVAAAAAAEAGPAFEPPPPRKAPAIVSRKLADVNVLLVAFGGDATVIRDLVESNGGSVYEYMAKSVTHVVAGEEVPGPKTKSKIQHARAKGIPIVKTSFLHECLSHGGLVDAAGHLAM